MFASPVPAPLSSGAISAGQDQPLGIVVGTAVTQTSPAPDARSALEDSQIFLSLLKKTLTMNALADIKALTTQIEKRFKHPGSSRSGLSRILLDFLELLLLCNSGGYAVHPTTAIEVEGENEAQLALHAAVASIACSAASSLVQFLQQELSLTSEAYSTCISNVFFSSYPPSSSAEMVPANENGGPTVQRSRVPSHHPLLLAAQCLYLLSRLFSMTAPWVKDMIDVVLELLIRMQKGWRCIIPIQTFVQGHGASAAMATLTWLLVFSVGNAIAPWQQKRMVSGKMLGENSLVYESHNSDLLRTTFTAAFSKLSNELKQMGVRGPGKNGIYSSSSSPKASYPTVLIPVVDGFISILYLQYGCLLCALKDESGYDYALEAFMGGDNNGFFPGAKGKVGKRIVQLAPNTTALLSIPVEKIFVAPYEVLSFLVDDMLPLIHHLSELELESLQMYLDQLLRLEEPNEFPTLAPLMDGGGEHGNMGTSAAYPRGNSGVLRYSPSRQTSAGKGALADGSNGIVPSSQGGNLVPDPFVALTPFTSSISHILEVLTICLRELPPSYLDPDLESDCAATWFIFRNAFKHLSEALSRVCQAATLSGTPRWDNYAYKLISRFMDVLTMIGRQTPYIERIAQLLAGAQSECAEMEWPQLVQQALICVGFYAEEGVPHMSSHERHGDASRNGDKYYPTPLNKGTGPDLGRESMRKSIGGSLISSSALVGHYAVGKLQHVHRQFTEAYARKSQQRYISSFFLLLRQLLVHPSLRPIVQQHMSLPLALSFLFASQQSPETLGSVLSLVSSMVFNHDDAVMVWEFLEKHQLLGPIAAIPAAAGVTDASSATSHPGASENEWREGEVNHQKWINSSPGHDGSSFFSGKDMTSGKMSSPLHPVATVEKTMNLLAHCQYEKSQGKFPITIGFLNLVIALFRYDPTPATTRRKTYHAVTHVVSQEIFCGLCRRSFVDPRERYTVMALGAAALRQALLVHFDSLFVPASSSPSASLQMPSISSAPVLGQQKMPSSAARHGSTISFATVMAHNLAPTDVVGEVQCAIDLVLSSASEVLSHQRAAIRQCLQLIHTAVHVAEEEKLHLFSLDVRTTQSPSLASKLLLLAQSPQDLLLSKAALELLLLFPTDIIAEAARYWHVQADSLAKAIKSFTNLLHPLAVVPPTAEVEPALAILSASFLDDSSSFHHTLSVFEEGRGSGGSGEASTAPSTSDPTLQDVKALLLHLLTIHAHATEPSLTAWLCGFQAGKQGSYGSAIPHFSSTEKSPSTTHSTQHNAIREGPLDKDRTRDDSTTLSPSSSSLLLSILLGATSVEVETNHPSLAVKYVKLLYVLRSSRLYGESVMREFLETRGAPLFLRLLQWEPTFGDPMLLSKYAYVIQLLTLEVLFVFRHAPKQLCMPFNTLPSIPVEVALSLLHPQDEDALAHSNACTQMDRTLVSSSPIPEHEETKRQCAGRGEREIHSSLERNSGFSSASVVRHASRPMDGSARQGGMELLSRNVSPDIAQWLLRVLRYLPIFPAALGIPTVSTVLSPYGDSFLTKASDQILQYDIAAVFDAIQMENIQKDENKKNETIQELEKNRSTVSTATLKARLAPYVEANKCFLVYACAENFITSLCQFVSLASCTVEGIPVGRLHSFACTILSALDLTSVLTVASQEKVAYRLCHLLPTIITKLHLLAAEEGEGVGRIEASPIGAAAGESGKYEDGSGSGSTRLAAPLGEVSGRNSRGVGGYRCTGTDCYAATMNSQRASPQGGRDGGEGNYGGVPFSGSSPFSTVAGNTSNVLHSYRRVGKWRSVEEETTAGGGGEGGSTLASRLSRRGGGSEVGRLSRRKLPYLSRHHALLPPVMEALIRWGPRLPCIRLDLYHSMVLLSVLPGVRLDECLLLYRCQEALLQLLVEEICQPYHLEARYHALTLLVQLVQSSETLCRSFACAKEGGSVVYEVCHGAGGEEHEYGDPSSTMSSTSGLGPLAMRCFSALFTAVDRSTLELTTSTHLVRGYGTSGSAGVPAGEMARMKSDLRSTQLLIRATFDLLRVVSVHHTPALLQGNLLLRCMKMEVWTRSVQVVLGHAVVAAQASGRGSAMDPCEAGLDGSGFLVSSSSSHQHQHQMQQEQLQQLQILKQGQEAARTLFLMTMRWINVMLASASGGTSPVLLEQVRYFFSQRRPLVDFFLRLPISFHVENHSLPIGSSFRRAPPSGLSYPSSPSSPFPSSFTSFDIAMVHAPIQTGGVVNGDPSFTPPTGGSSSSHGEENVLRGAGWTSLSLYVELSAILRALASSSLAVEECRRLAVELAIPQLLLTFAKGVSFTGEAGHAYSTTVFDATRQDDDIRTGRYPSSPSPASCSTWVGQREGTHELPSFSVDYRRWVVLYHLSDFLLRCEYGRRGEVEEDARNAEMVHKGPNNSGASTRQKEDNAKISNRSMTGMDDSTASTETKEGMGVPPLYSTSPSPPDAVTGSLLSVKNVIRHRPHDIECILYTIETLSNQCLRTRAAVSEHDPYSTLHQSSISSPHNDHIQEDFQCMLLGASGASSAFSVARLMECYVFTLHSLVCLLQSLVLPLCESSCESCGHNFPLYLQSLNLERYTAVLKHAQEAVQQLCPLYAGCVGERMDGKPCPYPSFHVHEEDVEGEARSRRDGIHTRNGDMSDGKMGVASTISSALKGEPPGEGRPGVPPSSQGHSLTPHLGVVPTPLDGRRGETNAFSTSEYATTGGLTTSTESTMRSPTTGRSSVRKENDCPMGVVTVNRKRRLGDYLPQHDGTSRLMEGLASKAPSRSFGEGSGDDERENGNMWYRPPLHRHMPSGYIPSSSALFCSPGTAPSWEDVLSIEYSLRLLHIVVANALRSVSVAIEYRS